MKGMSVFRSREVRTRVVWSRIFFVLFVALLAVALTDPHWGTELVPDYRRGVDIVFAFDVSRSMEVRDCPPLQGKEGTSSRLERGIAIAREMASDFGDLRRAVALGKGRGVLAVPLTWDSEAVLGFLDGISEASVTGRSTDVESLVDAASLAFKDNLPSRRIVFLFSDGESWQGSLDGLVERAAGRNIAVCPVGLGSPVGGLVPGLGDVISRPDEAALRRIAAGTSGVYTDGNAADAARSLIAYVGSLRSDAGLLGHRREPKARWHLFVIAAILCFSVSRLLGYRMGKGRGVRDQGLGIRDQGLDNRR
jgi:Ca-activated chloride channel family protein